MAVIVSIIFILPFIIKFSLQIDTPCSECTDEKYTFESYENFKTASYPQFTSFNSISINYARLMKIYDFMFGNYCIMTLDLSGNKIENVSRNGLSSIYGLNKLILIDNNLISLKNLINSIDSSNITSLILDENKVVYIDAKFPQTLTYISMKNNFLTSIEENNFQNLSKLEQIYLQSNQISKIHRSSFFGLYNLNKLDISRNMIESLKASYFRDTENLRYLFIYSNKIKWIEEDSFVNLVNLNYLLLFNNEIKVIDKNVLNGMNKLLRLTLDYNEIDTLTADSFVSLKKLDILYIRQMKLKKIELGAFDNCVKITWMELNFNQLTELNRDLFKKLIILKRLSVKNNVLARIESNTFSGLENLNFLTLENNMIKTIEPNTFTNLPKLDQLFLGGNLIRKIPSCSFVDLPNLTKLYLNSNLIGSIEDDAFVNITILDTLDLSKNKLLVIKSFYFKSLDSLITLKLNQNGINLIETGSFQSLTEAQLIDLSDNFIIIIESGAFKGVYLESLILKKNQIEEISNNIFTGSLIEVINMENIGLTSLKSCSMSTLINMTEISLGFNKLASISKNLFCMDKSDSISELLVINLNNNRIRSLEFLSDQFPNLLTLNLEWNLIEYLVLADFQGLEQLESLNINNNRLISIQAGFFKRLNLINIDASNLELEYWRKLDLDEFSINVQKIDMSFNNFNSININTTLYQIISFSLRRTNITLIESLKTNLISNLISLDLSENSIQDLAMFKWFQLKKLTSLSLTNLNITNLESFLQFPDNSMIRFINLSFNSISSLGTEISQFNELKTLDLSNNHIEYISEDMLGKRSSICYLYLENNKIKFFPYVFRLSLLIINLSNNHIRKTDIILKEKLIYLRVLDLSRNQFVSIQFENIFGPSTNLSELYLNKNRLLEITSNDLSYFPTLNILDISSNRVNRIDKSAFKNMDRLRILNLAENNLTELNSNTFRIQLQLVSLNLSHNRLELIKQELFSNLYNLKQLDLSHNFIRFIEDYSFKSASLLETIVLDSNPTLELSSNSFYGLDSIDIISIGFYVLSKWSNKQNILSALNPVKFKNVGDRLYFRSISLIYKDENKIDCELVLEFLKSMIQVNLRSDYDFVLFNKYCYDIKLI